MVSHFRDQNTSPEPIEKVKAKLKDQLKGVPRREGDTTWNPKLEASEDDFPFQFGHV